jgi:hypothetical protein
MTTARTISTLLQEQFCQSESTETITVEEILRRLDERGFGVIIILLGLPIAIPGCPPPIPSIFALPLCVLCLQMVLRYDTPVLPGFIARKQIKTASLQRTITKAIPWLQRLEAIISPRIEWLSRRRGERYVGLIMLVFSLTILIPVPMTNTVPGISVILMSIGLLSRDGLVMIVGAVLGSSWLLFLAFLAREAVAAIVG